MFRFTFTTCAILCATGASADANQCWFYLHNTLAAQDRATCAATAESYLDAAGAEVNTRPSSDGHLLVTSGRVGDTSIEVLCYDVNAERGPVMAVIMAAGTGEKNEICEAARLVFEEMQQ